MQGAVGEGYFGGSGMRTLFRKLVKSALWAGLFVLSGQRFHALKVVRGPAKGVTLSLDLRSQGSYWLGLYDDWILTRVDLARFISAGDTVWDCGAFVGYYTAIFRLLVGDGGSVVSFEGSKTNYEALSRLPILNSWDNVTIVNKAVGPAHSTVKFAGERGGSSGPRGLARTAERGGECENLETVESCGTDEIVFDQGYPLPSFIKFDIETGEIYALHNGDTIFSQHRPTLLLELHGLDAMEAAGVFLEKYGYQSCPVHLLPHIGGGRERWDRAFCSHAVNDGSGLSRLDQIPHMLFCLPNERAPLASDKSENFGQVR